MALRFLQISDTEVGFRPAYLGTAHSERGREVLETFRDAIGLALDPARAIDGVLIPGNLLHTHRPDAETWSFVEEQFARLAAAEKLVVCVPGSRDSAVYRNSVWLTESLPGVLLIKDTEPGPPIVQRLGDRNVFFYGLAPRPGEPGLDLEGLVRNDEDGLHIGLIHAAVQGHPERESRPKDRVTTKMEIAQTGLDYVALGGYHEHAVYRLDGCTAAYSGTLEGQDLTPGDLGPKSALIVEIGDEITFERVPLARRLLADEKIDLAREGVADIEDLESRITERADERLIVRFTLTGPLEFLCDLRGLRKKVQDRFAWLEIRDQTDVLGSALLRRIEGENTVRGHFTRRILAKLERCERQAQMSGEPRALEDEARRLRRALRLGLEPFLAQAEDMKPMAAAEEALS